MDNDYCVNVYDCAGQFASEPCATFDQVLATVAALRAKYSGKVVLAFNLDRCDYDTDGLTEDERDAVDEVL